MVTGTDTRNNEGNLGLGVMIKLTANNLCLPALRSPLLILRPLRSIYVIGIHLLMLLLLLLRQLLPIMSLLRRQTLPLLADRFGKIGLSLFLGRAGHDTVNRRRGVLLGLLAILAALSSEEYECVLRPLDVVFVAFFRPALDVTAT